MLAYLSVYLTETMMQIPHRRTPALDARNSYPTWSHDDVLANAEQWRQIRDCIAGHQAIRDRCHVYLPKRSGMSKEDYDAYVEYAPYFNMTSRTVGAMVGTASRREPKLTGIPERLRYLLPKITYDNSSAVLFIKKALFEVTSMGRYGILVDMDAEGRKPPYLEGFAAENIIDWQTGEVEGRQVLTAVVLRSIRQKPRAIGGAREIQIEYRILELVPEGGRLIYRQRVYLCDEINADITGIPDQVIEPKRFGQPLTFIPFIMPGALSTSPDVDQSPIAGVSHMQVSHYQSSADLEFARWYTGNPVYWVNTSDGADKDTEYALGPSRIWLLGPNGKAGVVEFNGQGLIFLENAMTQKEDMAAKLGGRLIGGRSRATSESDNQLKMQESNEHSVLLNVVVALNHAMTTALQWWAFWQGIDDTSEIACEISTEFMSNMFGARELRAVQEMYAAGLIDLQTFHFYFQRAEVIPDWLDYDEFKASIEDPDQFPNLPDVLARMRGHSDKASWQAHKIEMRKLRLDERASAAEIQNAQDKLALERKKAAKPPPPKPAPEPQPGGAA